MNKLKIKSFFKVISIFLLVITFITITTRIYKLNIIYQVSVFLSAIIYYLIVNREKLKNLLDLFRFLIVVIVLYNSILFIYKVIKNDFNYALNFYRVSYPEILIRVFVLPNLFAFTDILTSRISFIDIIIISKNNIFVRALYIILISGIEVMERLRVYFEYHPLNNEKGIKKMYHFLAVPLALFFGINKKFESKLESLQERDEVFKE